VVAFLTDPANVVQLRAILAYHVLPGVFTSAELTARPLLALQGNDVAVTTDPVLRFNTAGVVEADILANNGVVFKIDEVLELPP
jgi:uncharacterized surface protein with fasciclin (FAS1) repeats